MLSVRWVEVSYHWGVIYYLCHIAFYNLSQTEPKLRRPRLIVPRIPRIAAACCPHIMQSSPGPRRQQPSAEFPRVCVSSPRQERPSWASSQQPGPACSLLPTRRQRALILLQLMSCRLHAPCNRAADTTAPLSGACTRLAALQHQHRFVAPVSVRAVSKCAVAGPSLGPAAWLTQLWIKVFVLLQPAGHLTGRQRGMGDSFRNKAHSLSATVVAPFIQTLVFLSRLCVGQIDGQYCILLRCRAYTTIITAEQRQKYKAEFNTYYAKYRKLHNVLDQVSKRFAHLESKLKHAQKGSEDFKVRTFDIFKYH